MQKWEYKLIDRTRSLLQTKGGNYKLTDWDLPIEGMLSSLGEEGWELVAVTARSGKHGDWLAGLTTEETWVFKRPQ